ncbi:MAG: hypothetical protein HQ528_11890, partial [Candidatus Marinimicrobia bacterium]|nr:hypothetical protein [Candidatus Neomarinimicrobiota bacterium]
MRIKYLLLAQFCIVALGFGQFSVDGNVQLSYGEDKRGNYYNETLINTNLTRGDLSAWMQFEYSNPPEVGIPFQGLRKIRLEYSKGPVQLKLGDLYEIWGRGLVLNQRDDQKLDFDNGLTGLSIAGVHKDRLRGQLIVGIRELTNNIGSDISYSIKNNEVGISYLQSRLGRPIKYNQFWQPDTLNMVHRVLGIRESYSSSWIDLYGEYVNKTTHQVYDKNTYQDSLYSTGHGFYGNLNAFLGSWSLAFEYKRYNFRSLNPFELLNETSYHGHILVDQQPPIAFREPSSTLLNRVAHQMDFNDDVGFQVDLTGSINNWFTLLVHYARSSRTDEWEGDALSWTKHKSSGMFPSTDPAANPFFETYFEIDGYTFSDRLHYQISTAFTRDVFTLLKYVNTDTLKIKRYEFHEARTTPLLLEWSLPGSWSIIGKLESQKLIKGIQMYNEVDQVVLIDSTASVFYEGLAPDGIPHDYQENTIYSFGISKAPAWSIEIRIEKTSVEDGTDQFAREIINP